MRLEAAVEAICDLAVVEALDGDMNSAELIQSASRASKVGSSCLLCRKYLLPVLSVRSLAG